MPPEFLVLLAVLHEGGWDEALMVAVGLGIAYVVIVWSGRRKDDDRESDEDDGDAGDGDRG